MRVKKSGKIIFGADLTRDERKAMDIEIKHQLAEYDKKHETEIDSLVLYILHEHFGFGAERLRRFYDIFGAEMTELTKRYEMENEEIWLCTKKLRDYGIDLDIWAKERNDR